MVKVENSRIRVANFAPITCILGLSLTGLIREDILATDTEILNCAVWYEFSHSTRGRIGDLWAWLSLDSYS